MITLSTKDHFSSLGGHSKLDHFRQLPMRVVAGHSLNDCQSITKRIDHSADLRQPSLKA
jgi:hypothetical protein